MSTIDPRPDEHGPDEHRPDENPADEPTVELTTTDEATRSTGPGSPDVDPAHEQSRTAAEVPPAGPATGASPRQVRVGTVVWGLVIAAVGVGTLALASGYRFDVELAFIGLVALAGVGLLVGSLVNGARRRGR